jgi:hypothetical protein
MSRSGQGSPCQRGLGCSCCVKQKQERRQQERLRRKALAGRPATPGQGLGNPHVAQPAWVAWGRGARSCLRATISDTGIPAPVVFGAGQPSFCGFRTHDCCDRGGGCARCFLYTSSALVQRGAAYAGSSLPIEMTGVWRDEHRGENEEPRLLGHAGIRHLGRAAIGGSFGPRRLVMSVAHLGSPGNGGRSLLPDFSNS